MTQKLSSKFIIISFIYLTLNLEPLQMWLLFRKQIIAYINAYYELSALAIAPLPHTAPEEDETNASGGIRETHREARRR